MLVAVLLAAQAPVAPEQVSVAAMQAHFAEWNGRQVRVRAWLHGCAEGQTVQRCYISPTRRWRKGGHKLVLMADSSFVPGVNNNTIAEIVVRGTVEENTCPADVICFDRDSYLRVDAIEMVGRHRL